MAVKAHIPSNIFTFIETIIANVKQKCPKSRKVESEIK